MKFENPTALRCRQWLETAVAEQDAQIKQTPPGPERTRMHGHLRSLRLRLARAKGRHSKAEWEAIVSETGGMCVRCGYQHDYPFEYPYKGYIVPLAMGGSDAASNLQPLCRSCVSSKKDETTDHLALFRQAEKDGAEEAIAKGA